MLACIEDRRKAFGAFKVTRKTRIELNQSSPRIYLQWALGSMPISIITIVYLTIMVAILMLYNHIVHKLDLIYEHLWDEKQEDR
jgi:hypothetical protein